MTTTAVSQRVPAARGAFIPICLLFLSVPGFFFVRPALPGCGSIRAAFLPVRRRDGKPNRGRGPPQAAPGRAPGHPRRRPRFAQAAAPHLPRRQARSCRSNDLGSPCRLAEDSWAGGPRAPGSFGVPRGPRPGSDVMNRAVWVGTLALSLGASLTDLRAQESLWRPAARPPLRVPFVRPLPGPGAEASIGRPVPLPTEGAGGDGAVRPAGGIVQAGPPPVRPAHYVVAAGDPRCAEVIATAGRVPAPEEEVPPPDLFAGERPGGPPSPPGPTLGIRKGGDWSAPYPIDPLQAPPPPPAGPPPGPT